MAADATYPVETIAELLNLTPRRVYQLTKEGIIPKASRGRYELVPAVRGYIKYLRDRAINADVKDGDTDPNKDCTLSSSTCSCPNSVSVVWPMSTAIR